MGIEPMAFGSEGHGFHPHLGQLIFLSLWCVLKWSSCNHSFERTIFDILTDILAGYEYFRQLYSFSSLYLRVETLLSIQIKAGIRRKLSDKILTFSLMVD